MADGLQQPPSMSTDENKRVIRRFIDEILAAGRVEAIDELVAPDFVSHTWDMTDAGRDRLKETTPQMHARLSDVEMTIDDLVAEDDRVVARLTSSATPTGDFMGVPAAGKRYTIGELHLFRVRDGRSSSTGIRSTASASCASSALARRRGRNHRAGERRPLLTELRRRWPGCPGPGDARARHGPLAAAMDP